MSTRSPKNKPTKAAAHTTSPIRSRASSSAVGSRNLPVRTVTPTNDNWTVVNRVPVPVKHAKLAANSGTGATIGAVLGAVFFGPAGAIFGAAAGGAIGAASAAEK